MKTIAKFFALIAFAGITFAACESSEDTIYPTITSLGITEEGDTFVGAFNVACEEGSKLNSVTVSRVYGESSQNIAENNGLSISKTNNNWVLSITIPTKVGNVRVDKIKIEASVSGSNGGTETKTFDTPKENTVPTETDLEAAKDFTFTRVGGNAGTGDLSTFGLAWTSNTRAIHANITKDKASKLVQLAAASWTSITTVEALKEAVDNATAIEKYSNISAEANGNHDDVLGVINGGVYYMLHVTKGTVTSNTSGTTITITGQYRK